MTGAFLKTSRHMTVMAVARNPGIRSRRRQSCLKASKSAGRSFSHQYSLNDVQTEIHQILVPTVGLAPGQASAAQAPDPAGDPPATDLIRKAVKKRLHGGRIQRRGIFKPSSPLASSFSFSLFSLALFAFCTWTPNINACLITLGLS